MSSKQIKRILSPLAGFLPVEKLLPPKKHRLILPFWHAVSDTPPPHLSQLYCVPTISGFERDLDFFLKNYKSSSIEDVHRHATNTGKPNENFFFPTFDDGLAECYQVIAPILKKKGIQAAFFINPSFVDNKALFHRHKASLILNYINGQQSKPSEIKEAGQLLIKQAHNRNLHQFLHHSNYADQQLLDGIATVLGINFNHYLAHNQPYMTLSQIKKLQEDGFLIGAHGMDHREFYLSSEDDIMTQISSSMEFLIQEINPPIKWFAFPFTDFKVPDSVFEKARSANLWDLSFGTAGIKDETIQNHLQRIPMESGKISEGKKVVRTEFLWYFLKTIFAKDKVRRS